MSKYHIYKGKSTECIKLTMKLQRIGTFKLLEVQRGDQYHCILHSIQNTGLGRVQLHQNFKGMLMRMHWLTFV